MKFTVIAIPVALFFLSIKPVFAAFSFNIASTSATTISSGDQEINVDLNITDLPSESYFRVALQKEGGTSYLGYVKNNNGDWAVIQPLSGDCTIYYKVSDTSTTSLSLKFKVGDDVIIDNGNYNLKGHRFTNTCKSYKEATNSYAFTVSIPTPILTQIPPTNTLTPNTPTPTKTSSQTTNPTATPTPTPIKSGPTSSPTAMKVPTKASSPTPKTEEASVLSENVTVEPTKEQPTPTPQNLPKIFIIGGGLFLLGAGILFYKTQMKGDFDETDSDN